MNTKSPSDNNSSEKEAFLGLLFQQHGEWAEAKDHWLQALSLDKKQGNDLGIGQALCNLGVFVNRKRAHFNIENGPTWGLCRLDLILNSSPF